MVKKHTNNKNIRKKRKKSMRGGYHKKKTFRQKGGARSNYCLYSSKNLGIECSNWDGIVMLTKGLDSHEYLYKFLGKKVVKNVRYGTSKDVLRKAIDYANNYLGIFKLSYFIKTVKAGLGGRDYETIRSRYSPRGFWNGIKDDRFRIEELRDYKIISKDILDRDITFSINDLSDKTPWFMKITNLNSENLEKDSAEYICKTIKNSPVNLTIGTTENNTNLETEMKVMDLNYFIKRTFGSSSSDKSILLQRNKILEHIKRKLYKEFCGDETIEQSLEDDEYACKNSMKEKKEWYKSISGTSHESRKPYNVPAIKEMYETFRDYDENLDTSQVIDVFLEDQDLDVEPLEYLISEKRNREEYKLLSFDPFTNYNNIETMINHSLSNASVRDLDEYVFGRYMGEYKRGLTGNRGIIQLEEFNYEILFKNRNAILKDFTNDYSLSPEANGSKLTSNIKEFYNKSKITPSNEESHELKVILNTNYNHPLLIDYIIVHNTNSKVLEYAVVTPYYHLLKISQKLQGKVTGSWGIGNDYHKHLCTEYLKFMMCKRFVGDILDMYIYKYKNTMTYPRISDDDKMVGDYKKEVDGVKNRDYQTTTEKSISNSIKSGYSSGESSAADTKLEDMPSSENPTFDELEEFKKNLSEKLTYEELVEECKKMDIDISNLESSSSTKEEKKKQLIILLIDKIFPSGMDLSQMIRHNEFIMKNNNPVEGFIRDNAYKNIDKTHDLENEIMVSKRDISSEKIIPDKTFIRNNRIQMKCPFCGNLSVDFTKSKSSKEGAMHPSNHDDGAYYYYCNNSDCRAFLGAFYRNKDSSEKSKGEGQINGELSSILSEKLNTNFNFQDVDIYPNDGSVKNEIIKLRYQYSRSQMPQNNSPDPQANSTYYQMQTINQMNPAQQMFTIDGADQVGQQIGQSPPMQGMFGNYNPFATTDTNAAMGMQSQIVHSPQGWNTTNDPNAQTGPGTENPIFTMGNYQVNAPGFGYDPNAQMGPTDPVNLTPGGMHVPMQGIGNDPNFQPGPGPQNPVFAMGNYQGDAPGFGAGPNFMHGGIFSDTGGVAPAGGFGGPMNQQGP